MADNQPTGFAGDDSADTDYSATLFMIQQRLARVNTAMPCKVVAVTNAGGVASVGFVDVELAVNQLDGAGNAVPRGVVHGLPYSRLQGGANAIIIDPEVGDMGTAVFCQRDISSVKANRGRANPGSARRYDYADGIYLGGILNGVPTQYVRFAQDGIHITSPNKVFIAADVVVTGSVMATGDVAAGTVSLKTHVHAGVQTGSGTSGPPVP